MNCGKWSSAADAPKPGLVVGLMLYAEPTLFHGPRMERRKGSIKPLQHDTKNRPLFHEIEIRNLAFGNGSLNPTSVRHTKKNSGLSDPSLSEHSTPLGINSVRPGA
jgi:hypothetical protein